jgi:hypothetical protein
MTHDERILIAAATTHVAFLDTERLISGQGDPVLGYIRDGRIAGVTAGVVTQDDRYLYLSNQFTSWITIIDLDTARSRGFTQAAIVGGTATGPFPSMGLEFSADGKYLYVPSLELPTASGPLTCNNSGGVHPPRSREGGILVFDVALVRVNPASSVTASVLTGCGTNRLALSSDGERMYVTLSLDDALLAFDVRPVQNGSPPTLIGRVPLAVTPIDVKVIDGGNKVVVSNASAASNNAPADEREALTLWNLTVIDAARLSEGKAAVVGTIPLAGGRPTNIHVASDNHTLFVASPMGIHVVDMDRVSLQPKTR